MKNLQNYIKILIFIAFIAYSTSLLAKRAAIIIDYDSKEVLFEINADTRNYPASLAKIMTLYIVFDYLHKNRLSWNSQMKVSKIASSRSPSKLYLEEGSYITVENAVLALVIKSANDVATVVAEHISKTEKEFAKLMTAYARNIGMKNTNFKNASGLPNRAQMTSARDIATLSHALISNFPEEYKLFSREKFVWKGKTYKSHNRLMQSYEGGDGIKTGYLAVEQYSLASTIKKDERRLISVGSGFKTKHQERVSQLSF